MMQIPSYLLTGLRDQTEKPNEVVFAVKECDTGGRRSLP